MIPGNRLQSSWCVGHASVSLGHASIRYGYLCDSVVSLPLYDTKKIRTHGRIFRALNYTPFVTPPKPERVVPFYVESIPWQELDAAICTKTLEWVGYQFVGNRNREPDHGGHRL